MGDIVEKKTGLALLREEFAAEHVSKLPKPTKKQTDDVKADFTKGIRCQMCGAWHHKDVVHLDYVGHAALTHRLLDCDPAWNWEPVAYGQDGSPAIDRAGGMWIKLTVCGVTRLGYGHADGKNGGDAIKEIIGDALRNAAMRFGAALNLWHKGELFIDEPKEPPPPTPSPVELALAAIAGANKLTDLAGVWKGFPPSMQNVQAVEKAKDDRKAALTQPAPTSDDEIPY